MTPLPTKLLALLGLVLSLPGCSLMALEWNQRIDTRVTRLEARIEALEQRPGVAPKASVTPRQQVAGSAGTTP